MCLDQLTKQSWTLFIASTGLAVRFSHFNMQPGDKFAIKVTFESYARLTSRWITRSANFTVKSEILSSDIYVRSCQSVKRIESIFD
jgi:hypothetical protein